MTTDTDSDVKWDKVEGEWKLKVLDDEFLLMHESMDDPVNLNRGEFNDLEEVLAEAYLRSPTEYNHDL